MIACCSFLSFFLLLAVAKKLLISYGEVWISKKETDWVNTSQTWLFLKQFETIAVMVCYGDHSYLPRVRFPLGWRDGRGMRPGIGNRVG